MAGQDKPLYRIPERATRIAARWLLVMGAILLGVYAAARTHAAVMSRAALREFSQAEQAQQKEPPTSTAHEASLDVKRNVDFTLWSMKRITAYEESLKQQFPAPLAVLEIPKIGVEVPVFDGTEDLTLNRGVGSIIYTAGQTSTASSSQTNSNTAWIYPRDSGSRCSDGLAKWLRHG